MKSALTVVLFRLFTIGVFVDGKEASIVSVMEGDSVTLKSGVTNVQTDDGIEWRFKGIRIDTFVDTLQLDSQTGDLKISNIRTKDSGLYKVKISSTRGSSVMVFNVTVAPADEVKSVIVMEGDSVPLRPDPTYIQRDDVIRWRFGQQTSPGEINRMAEIFNTFNGPDERFRDRLKLDHQTGSLIITNTRTTDSGLYEAEISSTRSSYTIHHTQSFNVTVSGEMKSVSVKEGKSVTLQIVTEIQSDDLILWMFGGAVIAEIYEASQLFYTHNGPDERFRDRLQLDNQTGSLTITNTRTTDSGNYKAEITGRRYTINKIITVTISGSGPQSGSGLQSGPGLQSGSGAVAWIVAAVAVVVLLAAAVVAGVVYYRRKNSERERQREENGVNRNTQKTEDPVTEETKLNDP